MSLLKFIDINKSYGRRQILHHVNITLVAGRCSLLTGPNGTGKTTLQRICAGLEKPDHCTISNGHSMQSWQHQRRYLQQHVVYLHQQPFMFDASVRENLAYGLPRKLDSKQRQQRLDAALAWAGLEHIADSWAKTLSGGERQRVSLARAWLSSPKIILLDEPTNNMDDEAKLRTLELLTSLKQQNMSLLITSHDAEHFVDLCDNWFKLSQGELVSESLGESRLADVLALSKTSLQVAL